MTCNDILFLVVQQALPFTSAYESLLEKAFLGHSANKAKTSKLRSSDKDEQQLNVESFSNLQCYKFCI